MNSRVLGTLAFAWLVASCSDSGDEGGAAGVGTGGVAGMMATSTPCTPNAVVVCPCVGGGMGTQTCNADGMSYAACMGCPPAGAGGTAAPMMPTPDGGALTTPDATVDAASNPGTGDGAVVGGVAEVGVSCGVGLPVLCEAGKELCCVRSLATDTCVAAGGCTCDVQGCDTLEVNCDGPEDCAAGEICCGTLGGGGGGAYTSFACAASCDYMGSQRQACHVGIDECPGNNVCANSQLLTNVQVCIDPMTIEQ